MPAMSTAAMFGPCRMLLSHICKELSARLFARKHVRPTPAKWTQVKMQNMDIPERALIQALNIVLGTALVWSVLHDGQ